MAILSRKEEKKISSSKAPLFYSFLQKSHSMTFKCVYTYILFLETPLATVVLGNWKIFPLFRLHFCFLVSDFKMHNTVFHFFFFKGTWPSVSLPALKAAPLFCKRRRSLLTNLALSQASENTGRVWGISPPLIIIVIIKNGKFYFFLAKKAQRMPPCGDNSGWWESLVSSISFMHRA